METKTSPGSDHGVDGGSEQYPICLGVMMVPNRNANKSMGRASELYKRTFIHHSLGEANSRQNNTMQKTMGPYNIHVVRM
jgi:hypothetical protein